MKRQFANLGLASLLMMGVLLAWDASGLDLAVARWAGSSHGFALRDDWLFSDVLHDGMRHAAWAVVVALCVFAVWPVGRLAELPFRRRLQLPAVALISTAAVVTLKAFSSTSCPWDLADFGGVAHHVSHWSGWRLPDGGSGHCFPAGHATAGFAFVGGWFGLREQWPRMARRWLAVSVSAGVALGLVQQWRGAHFMSHTLWSGWVCWMVGLVADPFFAKEDGEIAP